MPAAQPYAGTTFRKPASMGKIQHVIIVFQENRSTDNLFSGLAGADTVTSGYNHFGKRVPLIPIGLVSYDLSHRHDAFVAEYRNGKMNGFDLEKSIGCKTGCPPPGERAYAYVPRKQVLPYFEMAAEWAFGDRMFQTNQGPSFPAHQYIISGTSTVLDGSPLRAAENPNTPGHPPSGGCDSPANALVNLIDANGNETQTQYPCFERLTMFDLLDARSVGWRYYLQQKIPGNWNGPDAIQHIRSGPDYANVVAPSSRILTDILGGNLAPVSWVTPKGKNSDHARIDGTGGPAWVASIVNAVGTSKYWNDTVIVVTWDDWGGWYDHVKPPVRDSYELGFRVPLLVISPYAKRRYVSHAQHEFGSILKFVEETFGTASLGTTDVGADDLADCFNFAKAPRAFVPIQAQPGLAYFIHEPPSDEPVDTDY